MNNIQSNTANHSQSSSPRPGEKPKTGMNKEIQLFGSSKAKTFSTKESIQFYRGIASMIKAQINTADALKYYAEGLPNKIMAAALMGIRDDINAGISVYEAFKRSKRFDDMTLGLIKAGMDSGRLDAAFQDLSERAKSTLALKKKIRKIVLIPALIFPILIAAFVYSQVKIIPKIKEMVIVGDYEPKGPVRFFFTLSDFVISWWIVGVIALAIIIAIPVLSNKIRQIIITLVMSKWRTLRKLIMGLRQVTFLGVIKLLHANGINLAKAITTSATSVKGTPLHDELLMAAEKYEKAGVPLSIAFTKYTSVDDQVVHMLSIGEKSASMGSQLAMLTEMYESDCEQLMEDFTNVLNLVVMLVATSMIALVFLGVFMPIFLMGPEMMDQR
ncbi:Type II secretory pathway, component PulF [Rubritalea squalenifaciens DSM 18772]|uniref:Type II secretory pathway, component PulF n=2 Tax=Rubritalea squalenifaciens TaxID=407226 RepID=A0A1M6RKS0_9BACT|nr:Type II secretory pathway, component PulF [Rubritalea squalenifaciens DSM 18772]